MMETALARELVGVDHRPKMQASLRSGGCRQGLVATVHIQIPRLTTLARHAMPSVVEGTLLPLAVFLIGLRLVGPWGAMVMGVMWSYGLIALRVMRRQRVPGLLLLGSIGVSVRTALAALSGSVVVYFLQPSLGTAVVATAFLLSVLARRPLAERLARDLVPLPPEVYDDGRLRRFFLQISLLWAATQFANAAITLWLLLTQSLGTFIVARMAASWTLTGLAIVLSFYWFHRSMARHGIAVTRAATAPAER
jgi:hypothetical protein